MPLYDYQCSQCQKITEVRHGFDAVYEATCEACGGGLKRVFNPAPILFKGSGFYVTDSRKPAAAEGAASGKAATPAAPASTTPASSSPASTPASASSSPAPSKESAA